MRTKYESTEQKFTTSRPSSINTLMPTAIETMAETTTKLIHNIPENAQLSEYLSSSSTFSQKSITFKHHQNSPKESSSTEYLSDSLSNTNTLSEQQSDKSNTRSSSAIQESSTLTSKEIQSSLSEKDKSFDSTQQIHDIQGTYTETSHSSFDTNPEIKSILTTNIQHRSKEDFTFSNLLPSELVEVLTKKYDINDCLKNCSGNGMCKLKDKSLFVCECFSNFAGSSCQINTLPCASNPCLNNATCVNNLANKSFTCHCQLDNNGNDLYFGKHCQNKVDVCANETCSKNGVCYDVNDKAKCKCFLSYSGEKCQIESDESKTRKKIIKTSTIIAIIVFVLFF